MKRTPPWVWLAAVAVQLAALCLCTWAMEQWLRRDDEDETAEPAPRPRRPEEPAAPKRTPEFRPFEPPRITRPPRAAGPPPPFAPGSPFAPAAQPQSPAAPPAQSAPAPSPQSAPAGSNHVASRAEAAPAPAPETPFDGPPWGAEPAAPASASSPERDLTPVRDAWGEAEDISPVHSTEPLEAWLPPPAAPVAQAPEPPAVPLFGPPPPRDVDPDAVPPFIGDAADGTTQIMRAYSGARPVIFGFYPDGNIRFVDVDGGRYAGKAESARARMREVDGTRAFTVQIAVDGQQQLQAVFTGGLHDAETLPLEPLVGWSVA